MSRLKRLRQRMRVDVAPVPVAPYAVAFDGVYDAIIIPRPMEGTEGGIALCRELRRLGVTTPIVIMVDQASVDDIVEAIDAGADDVIAQGVGMELYVARLQSLQRRRALLRDGSAQRTPGVILDLRRTMGHNERGPPLAA
jgi:DNA-binding response OmpR family regulator